VRIRVIEIEIDEGEIGYRNSDKGNRNGFLRGRGRGESRGNGFEMDMDWFEERKRRE